METRPSFTSAESAESTERGERARRAQSVCMRERSSSSSFIYFPLVDTQKIAIVFLKTKKQTKNEKCTKLKFESNAN